MDKITYEKLKNKLDAEELRLKVSHPVPSPTELPHSVGLIITEDTEVSNISRERLTLFHSMLHMFYQGKSGRGLSPKTIEQLHREVVSCMTSHKSFDSLDKNGLH